MWVRWMVCRPSSPAVLPPAGALPLLGLICVLAHPLLSGGGSGGGSIRSRQTTTSKVTSSPGASPADTLCSRVTLSWRCRSAHTASNCRGGGKTKLHRIERPYSGRWFPTVEISQHIVSRVNSLHRMKNSAEFGVWQFTMIIQFLNFNF